MTLTWYRHFERNCGLNQILIIVTNKQTNKQKQQQKQQLYTEAPA
jgi:hypothetical protein